MVIFEIKHKGRVLWLPEIAPGNVSKGHPYFFPEVHETGKLYVFTSMEKARQFFQLHCSDDEIRGTEKIDLEKIEQWSKTPSSNDIDAEQLNMFYMIMVDYFTDTSGELPKYNEYELLREINQQIALKLRHIILSKAARENPETSKNLVLEKPNNEILQKILRKPELKAEVKSLVFRFGEIIHINTDS